MDQSVLALWEALAYQTVWRLAATQDAFSTDDVSETLESLWKPDDPRALGPILSRCAKDGLIAKSDTVVKSQRRVCHGRPVNVWLSMLRDASALSAAAYVASKRSSVDVPPLLTFLER